MIKKKKCRHSSVCFVSTEGAVGARSNFAGGSQPLRVFQHSLNASHLLIIGEDSFIELSTAHNPPFSRFSPLLLCSLFFFAISAFFFSLASSRFFALASLSF